MNRLLLLLALFCGAVYAQVCPPPYETEYCGNLNTNLGQYLQSRQAQCQTDQFNARECVESVTVMSGTLYCNVRMTQTAVDPTYGYNQVVDYPMQVVCPSGYNPSIVTGRCTRTAPCENEVCQLHSVQSMEYFYCNVLDTKSGSVAVSDCDQPPVETKGTGSQFCREGCWMIGQQVTGRFVDIQGDWKQAWLDATGPLTGIECDVDPPTPWASPDGGGGDDPPPDDGGDTSFTDPPLPGVGGFYTPKWPDGLGPLFREHFDNMEDAGLGNLLSWMVPTGFTDGGTPVLPFEWNGNTFDLSPPVYVWNFVRLVIILSAVLLARRLIFGG